MMITVDTKIIEIMEIPEIQPASKFFIGGSKEWYEALKAFTFNDVQSKSPTWNAEDMVYGMKRLVEIAKSGKRYLFDIYSQDEIAKEPKKGDVKLFYFPGKADKPFVLICAGGAFGAVCSLVEAFPVAARLNELGYNAFCLNYRTAELATRYFAVVPKALEDIARALKFIDAQDCILDKTHYAVCGFSAGGHLCAQWCSPKVGYKAFNMKKPDALFLVYGLLSSELFSKDNQMWQLICTAMYGESFSQDDIDRYDTINSIDSEYPATFAIGCIDDTTVPTKGLDKMEELFKEHGVLHKIERPQRGGHGFGLGSATDAKGWLDRAVSFWEEIR